jgi:hypothetical protein
LSDVVSLEVNKALEKQAQAFREQIAEADRQSSVSAFNQACVQTVQPSDVEGCTTDRPSCSDEGYEQPSCDSQSLYLNWERIPASNLT